MNAPSSDYLAVAIDSPNSVTIAGERLEFTRIRRPVVQNVRNHTYAMYLALGHNAYIRVHPVRKSGEIGRRHAYWSHDSHWAFAGEVQHCIAFRRRVVPDGAVRRFFFRLCA